MDRDHIEQSLMALVDELDEYEALPELIPAKDCAAVYGGEVDTEGRAGGPACSPKRGGPRLLSAAAPAFVPSSLRPHVITIFNPATYGTQQLKCDLTDLSVGDIRLFAAQLFSLHATNFNLLLSGQPITCNLSSQAIDIGLSNGTVLVLAIDPTPAVTPRGRHTHTAHTHAQPQPPYSNGAMYQSSPARSGSSSGSLTPSNSSLMTYAPMRNNGDSSPEMTPEKEIPTPVILRAADFYSPAGAQHLQSALAHGAYGCYYEAMTHVLENFSEMAKDPTASKVVIAAIEAGQPDHVAQLLMIACRDVRDLCKNMSGAEVLMALALHARGPGTVSPTGTPLIVEAMVPHAIDLCNSMPGRKLVQSISVKFTDEQKQAFYHAVCRSIAHIAPNQCGCITLQRMYDYASRRVLKDMMHEAIMYYCSSLLFDPFGNYVLQHIISRGPEIISERVVDVVRRNIAKCAVDKIGSNVIERCLACGSEKAKTILILAVCDKNIIELLVKDSFGNYVIQTTIEHAPVQLLDLVRRTIAPVIESSPYSFRIESKLQKRLKRGSARGTPHQHVPPMQPIAMGPISS